MKEERLYRMLFSSVYPLYLAKIEKKGRTKAELDHLITWLTGYNEDQLTEQINLKTDFETFFKKAPTLNPNRMKIKGLICGHRVEEITDPILQNIRYLDKIVDELAKGKALDKIKRA